MSKVKVAVRVRPMNKREIQLGAECVVDMENNQTILTPKEGHKKSKTFAFDHCFWSMDPSNPKFSGQEFVFEKLGADVLVNAFGGYNACIFAYGQTGSGKSFSMMGSLTEDSSKGIIPRLCDTMFDRIVEGKAANSRMSYKVEVSYMEIYCEKVRDLLCPKGGKHSLKVREHKILGPYVEGLSKLAVNSFKDINELMSEGNKSRTVAATQMNAESSRSHAVFSILLSQTEFHPKSQLGTEKVAKMSLVDLAGSERAGKTGALGDRLKEGSNINKSLTTLGLVISSLADMSAGKRGKTTFIPYRDSILTWLLKDNLGGNSKTVMIATVSPSSDNYEESLSTLRYADRAKRIVNHAVVNEDKNSRVIRELREEVEKLKQMLGMGGVGGGGEGGSGPGGMQSARELTDLTEKLRISESLMQEMTMSWEQKVLETERIHMERQTALENMGISIQESGIGVQSDKYYLVNLNADPSMNELLVCYLKDVTRIGRPEAEVHQDIQLKGLGISNEHCIIEVVDKEVFLTPVGNAKALVNGVSVTERTTLDHGSRILLGNNHLFRLSCPGQTLKEDETLMNYDQAMNEISMNELKDLPMFQRIEKKLMEQHDAEKEGALSAQKEMYEKELSKLKEQLESSNTSTTANTTTTVNTTTPSPQPLVPKLTTLEEEWEHRNRERLITTVLHANRKVQEANMLAEALHKDTLFKVTLTVPRSFLSPREKLNKEDMQTSNEVAIRVLHKQRGTDSVWSLDTLAEKVLIMRDMYERMEEGGSLVDETIGPDPFYDLEQHALLGVANISLECLLHDIEFVYDAPIVAPTGKICGKLKVLIRKVPTPLERDQELGEDIDTAASWSQLYAYPSMVEEFMDLQPGSPLSCQVTVLEGCGLPREYCHYVFCQYQFWGQEEPMIIPPLQGQNTTDQKMVDRVQFSHSQTFTVEITEDFLNHVEEGVLGVEVWGHRRSGFMDIPLVTPGEPENEGRRQKSFPEKWSELTQRLELWVEIMELNDQGEYVPVELQSKPDVMTGGVFMIRQGQSRRINVAVQPVVGPGPESNLLRSQSIASISIGSCYLRNRYDEALDSYQEQDLERMRTRWNEAVMNRRDFLDAEVRKLMDKKDPSVSDLEKQNELLDQWAMLQWQRQAVLQPKPGSGVPGAPTNWNLSLGMELRVPVLFLDMTVQDEEGGEETLPCPPTQLFGEKPESMIEIPIIKKEENDPCAPRATASWDSTVHDAQSLNRVTGSNDRVYATLRVKVKLSQPPNVEVTLNKRICLCVYKKLGFGASILRAFKSRDNRTACGVMCECVLGIPKSEGMQAPPKIPANPSFVELDEDENAVEKFKTAMGNIASILTLDKLKQEVALKEKLASSGRTLKKRYSVQTSTAIASTPNSSGVLLDSNGSNTPESEELRLSPLAGEGLKMAPLDEESTTVGGGRGSGRGGDSELGPEAMVLDEESGEMSRLNPIPEEGGMEEELNNMEPEQASMEPTQEQGSGMELGRSPPEEEKRTAGVSDLPTPVDSKIIETENEVTQEVVAEEGGERGEEATGNEGEETAGGGEEEVEREGGGEREEERGGEGEGEGEGEREVEREGGGEREEERGGEGEGEREEETGREEEEREGDKEVSMDITEVPQIEVEDEEGAGELQSEEAKTEDMEASMSELADDQEKSQPPSSMSSPKSLRSEDSQELSVTDAKRRKSDGELLGGVLKQKKNASSRSTSSSPLTSRKSEGTPKREPSPTLSSGESETSSSISMGAEASTPKSTGPIHSVGEKVMVEVNGSFRMGVVKFTGETEFAPGDWVGVALERPLGKHNGTVKGVKYFKCKDKHGVFVKKEKLIQSPSSSSRTSSPSPRLPHGGSKSASPSARRKPTSHPGKGFTPLSSRSSSSSRPSSLSHRHGLAGSRRT